MTGFWLAGQPSRYFARKFEMRKVVGSDQNILRLALVSLNQKWEDKDYNFMRCRQFVEQAHAHGAGLVVFPEMTLTGFSMNTGGLAEDASYSPTISRFGELAQRTGTAIVFGLICRQGEKAANTLIYISSKGEVLVRYVKMHPFSFAGEDEYFIHGDRLALAEFGVFTIGFTICYDLRFPEVYSALARQCNLIINIANWPQRRISHWRTLLQARAIENQIYMVGVNRTGMDGNGLNYEGSSHLVDANGDMQEAIYSEQELDIYEVSGCVLSQFRQQFATTPDRKPDLYRSLI